ncbi:MAG: phosphodiester glycosidase family protein [Butyricicoccus sp.]
MRTSAKHPCRLIAAALAALQLCAGAAGAVFDNSFSYTYSLGSGLQYSRTEGKNSAGLQRANVLTYSPNTGVTPIMVYADEQLYGSKATITNAVKYLQNQGKTVLGGTNADFFVMSTGIPIGLVIDSGELISSDAWQYAVGFKKDGTAVLGRPTMGIRVSGKSGTVNVSYFNKTRTTAGAYLLDHNYDDSTHFAAKGTSIILERVDDTPVKVNGSVKLKVVNKGTGSSPITITKNQMVLTKSDGANVPSWVDFEVGEEVTLSIASNDSNWSDVQYAVGGKLLMDNSTITTDGIDAGSTRRARSAVGVKADGTVVLYEIDGNQSSYSIGLTAAELGQELKDLGCVRAICLDGGGSSAMAIRNPGESTAALISQPSDGSQRVRQLHFLCEQHRVGRRDGSCCAHAQPPLCAPGWKYLVLGQGCRCVLRLGGRTDRPQLHGE